MKSLKRACFFSMCVLAIGLVNTEICQAQGGVRKWDKDKYKRYNDPDPNNERMADLVKLQKEVFVFKDKFTQVD